MVYIYCLFLQSTALIQALSLSTVKHSNDIHQAGGIRLNLVYNTMSSGAIHRGYTQHNRIELLKGGSIYFTRLLELIHGARHSIHVQVYIFDDDATGTLVANALAAAAAKGIPVFVLADGFASQRMSGAFVKKLRSNGIHFRYFEPLLKSSHFYFGRRMHHKLVVIDGKEALVGGINLADRYNDIVGINAWLDFALYVNGEAALQLYRICRSYWKEAEEIPEPLIDISSMTETCSLRVSRNDWVKGKHEIWRTYFSYFNQASESITIICSYFLPGRTLRKQLAKAVKRGVRVKVILAGPSDVPIAKYAERYLYQWMLRNGIHLYEYQPTVLHAKMTVVDQHWVTIGSYNINNISAYASIELNLDVRNKPFARKVHEQLNAIISNDCVEVNEKKFVTRLSIFKKLLHKLSYEIIRLITNLSTFYFRHE